jgi:Ketopantoate reductase PanE/ApbA
VRWVVYFGGRLAQAERDVTFLVRPSRVRQFTRDGLRIINPHGDAVLSPKLVSADLSLCSQERQAINYAQSRATFRSGEIRILDSTGKLKRTIAFTEADRMLIAQQ